MYMANIQRFGQKFAKNGPEPVTDRYQSVTNCHQLARRPDHCEDARYMVRTQLTTGIAPGVITGGDPEENQQPTEHRWP